RLFGGRFSATHNSVAATPLAFADLPLNFHPAAIRALAVVRCYRTLDRRRLDFSALITRLTRKFSRPLPPVYADTMSIALRKD
ncbi:MAG: hypothetical protein KGL96_15140, partial [Hyphomicrobiales bacterium]|nr:hypothetical protein [Hyphomicrobiales bacterium]